MTKQAIQHTVSIKADAEGNPPARIHLMSTGHWHAPWHGNFEMTPSDLAEMVQHFDEGVASVEGSKKLPINYGHDISGKAAGWITGLSTENNGNELWGDVEWTPEGKQMLADGSFRYISPEWNPRSFPYQDPEDEESWLDNVFTGAGLTNIPLFKKLKPIMASIVAPTTQRASVVTASDNKPNGEPSMDLEALRAKKPEDLSEDEKTFVAEHAEELTAEERKTFDVQTDDDKAAEAQAEADAKEAAEKEAADKAAADAKAAEEAKGVEASTKGVVSISASELASLKASAARADKLALEIDTDKAKGIVASAVKKGQIKSGDSERWTKVLLASGAQRKEVESLLAGLPVNESLGKELGDGGANADTSAQSELETRASKMASESDGKLTYSQAAKSIMASDTDLRERVNAERANKSKES